MDAGAILAGKYRLEREIGRGAFGRVVVARHLGLGQDVALKILDDDASPSAARRFVREAQLAARLKSQHVVRVLDAGMLESLAPYVAMELLDGEDLARLLKRRGPLPVHEACSYVRQACEGIGEAHALGMVHRDIKPSNVFLTHGIIKVLDFGIAKAAPTSAESVANATQTGALLGTPTAMSPEQIISSRHVDARTDVWALGVLLHTLIAGRPPFVAKTLRETFEAIIERAPPALDASVPKGVVVARDRCLRKKPDERYANANELAEALAPFVVERGARKRWLLVGVVALASSVVGAAVVVARHRPARVPAALASAPREVVLVPMTTATPEPIATLEPSTSASSAPPPPPPKTTTTAKATAPSAVGVTRTVWSAAFASQYPKAVCANPKTKTCFTIERAECEDKVGEIIQSCLASLEPQMPLDMTESPRSNKFSDDANRCVLSTFQKQMNDAGRMTHGEGCR